MHEICAILDHSLTPLLRQPPCTKRHRLIVSTEKGAAEPSSGNDSSQQQFEISLFIFAIYQVSCNLVRIHEIRIIDSHKK
jgi:hypothetical protein